ncbi:hypothetical protein [Ramlibacter algicola]|uniref:Uncharacterized protein n=1 Tax=Ramlibacter algicola TaxID=2795217 RepID=A0A934Q468_9BURK|nr:hypothetical protein [Ramlibacter algicola]MBK0393897.1 hypothetical protein [Ramlibacter algicola]
MSAAVEELKTRARVRLNAMRREGQDGKLREQLHEVAGEVGFTQWEHARRVLSGEAVAGEDVGTFWYAPRTSSYLNEWFADLAQALAAHARSRGGVLLPYKRQFVIVQPDFLRELALDPHDPAIAEAGRDLVRAYGSSAWHALAAQRVRAPRSSFEGG